MLNGLNRRDLLGSGVAFLGATFLPAGLVPAQAQARPLAVFGPSVIQTVSTAATGGDIVKDWAAEKGLTVQWTTFTNAALRDRLFREASLDTTTVDVGFLLNTDIIPQAAALFETLDPWLAKDPIADFDDVFQGLRSGMQVQGKTLGIPFRHASTGLHYNEQILAERGFSKPPSTVEELAEMAAACAFRRDDGTQVYGLVTPGVTYPNVIDIARAWDGDFITADYKCVADQPGMMNAIKLLRALFEKGAYPRNFATIQTEDVNTFMQQGRSAFSIQSMGRTQIYNDPTKSRYPGKLKTVALPAAAALKSKYPDAAPVKVEFWGAGIPQHAQRKDLSWSFIKNLSTKGHTVMAALNGNGPVRASTYDNDAFRKKVAYADQERLVLKVARVPLPAFENAARAGDIFKEEVEAAVLGLKSPEAAMQSVVARVNPLLPA